MIDIIVKVAFIMLIPLSVLLIVRIRKLKKNEFVKNKVKAKKDYSQELYIYFSKNFFTRRYVREIRKRYEMVAEYNEHNLRKKTIKTFIVIAAIAVVTFIVLAFIAQSILNLLYMTLILFFVTESIIDVFVVNLQNKIMDEQVEFNNIIKHRFYEYKIVEDAIYEAADEIVEKSHETSLQGLKIFDILNSKNINERMYDYYDTAPNRFFKMLLGLSYIVKEFGDTKDEQGRSQYIKNISTLNKEIRLEVQKRKSIIYYLKSLNIITLIPILAINPIKTWAASNFFALQQYYESTLGFISEILMYVVIVVSYFIIRRTQETDKVMIVKKSKAKIRDSVRNFIQYIIPLPYTKKRARKEKIIREAGEHKTLEDHYIEKAIMAAAVFIASIVLVFIMHGSNVSHILNNPDVQAVKENFMGGKLSPEDQAKAESISEYDRKIIKATNKTTEKEKIEAEVLKSGDNEENITTVVNRILEKNIKIGNEYFRWYELLLCLFIGLIGYFIPDFMILQKRKINQIEMEDEVSLYQSIILILIGIDRISVDEILEWLTMYSRIFKEHLEHCLTELDSGIYRALEKLKNSVEHTEFKEVIRNLQTAAVSLSLKEAFDELESEKEYFLEKRKETNNRIIEKKKGVGNIVGFMPIYALVILYMMIPMIVASVLQMGDMFTKLLQL